MNNWLRSTIVVRVALSCRTCPEELSSEGLVPRVNPEGTRACKSKAQLATLSRVVSAIVPFYLVCFCNEKSCGKNHLDRG